jgi:hypothetical protein
MDRHLDWFKVPVETAIDIPRLNKNDKIVNELIILTRRLRKSENVVRIPCSPIAII